MSLTKQDCLTWLFNSLLSYIGLHRMSRRLCCEDTFCRLGRRQCEVWTPNTHLKRFFALLGLSPMKAPGPDDFQVAFFFQKAWHTVGPVVTSYIKRVLGGDENIGTSAEALVVLIPKVDHPDSLFQFRQISLCNVINKLITKVVVNRLNPIMRDVVEPTHGSFMRGRQILIIS